VARSQSLFRRLLVRSVTMAYVIAVAGFLWGCAQCYIPGKGFTYLVKFGQLESSRYLPELKAVNHYEIEGTHGYDGQFYAQIAMHPQLGDPALRDAVDGVVYRARRILFCWTAYALALGDPVRALHIYAVQNIVAWLALAALLWRWFPATSWSNFLRWAGVLFSVGLVGSVNGALTDGPSLLLIAAGAALAEAGRPWWSAALLGLSGLGKETNVLAGAALAPKEGAEVRAWMKAVGRLALVALPLAIWLVTLKTWLGEAMDAGARNFAPPLVAYAGKWREVAHEFAVPNAAHGSVLVMVALTVQFLFFALRPRWRELWWRIGAAYAGLMAVLGAAVWEGYPGAAARVLLPMTLAFNIAVPRGARWWAVLLLGNASVLLVPDVMTPPLREVYRVSGPYALRIVERTGEALELRFDENWFGPEQSLFETWRWNRGNASIMVHNLQPFALVADVSFVLRTRESRHVAVTQAGRTLWEGQLAADSAVPVNLHGVRLPAGETLWRFETDRAGAPPNDRDLRPIAFSVRDLVVRVREKAEP
jgi:hypothetical protein